MIHGRPDPVSHFAISYAERSLDLSDCRLGLACGPSLAAALSANATLTHLDVSDNPGLGDAGSASLGAALARNSVLTELSLGRAGLGPAAAAELAAALRVNAALKRLDASRNQV